MLQFIFANSDKAIVPAKITILNQVSTYRIYPHEIVCATLFESSRLHISLRRQKIVFSVMTWLRRLKGEPL